MHFLHYEILNTLLNHNENTTKYLIYAGFFQGLKGLQRWKREALFLPANLYLATN